jgi:hypothetical protein
MRILLEARGKKAQKIFDFIYPEENYDDIEKIKILDNGEVYIDNTIGALDILDGDEDYLEEYIERIKRYT